MGSSENIAQRLAQSAVAAPERAAIVATDRIDANGRATYRQLSFAELEESSTRIARALVQRGAEPGKRLVLFVPFGIRFIQLTFGVLKSGATLVLIDPGMGRRNIFECLREVQPDGYLAIPRVHWLRQLLQLRSLGRHPAFLRAKLNISVGPRSPGARTTYDDLLRNESPVELPFTQRHDAAAIIFTSGSTGPPKGVLYEHGMFDAQVELIRDFYNIQPGEVDLPGFPLFGLFNACMGVTTVIPDMDPTRPAQVDPKNILRAIRDQQVTQAFGSPAFWNRVGRHCEQQQLQLPTLKRALSAGGPVPVAVLQRVAQSLTGSGAELHTPYGATESLPVASIGSDEVLRETAGKSRLGEGTCVGRVFPSMEVRIIAMTDAPIADVSQVQQLGIGEIGEIVVRGPSVTREYFQRPDQTRRAKIADGDTFWHRIGDVGYFDAEQRLWFCGRQAHVVEVAGTRMYSVCCEAIFNEHPAIYRTALVGIGKKPNQQPVIIAEPETGHFPATPEAEARLRAELLNLGRASSQTVNIERVLFHPSLPVDTRHNVKINREALAEWVVTQLRVES